MTHSPSLPPSSLLARLPHLVAAGLLVGALAGGGLGSGCGDSGTSPGDAAAADAADDGPAKDGLPSDPHGELAPGSGSVAFKIGTDSYTIDLEHVGYDPASPGVMHVEGAGGTTEFMLAFSPTAPGSYSCGASPYVFLHVGLGSGAALSTYHAGTCTLVVTKYGAVRGALEGTFTAHLMKAGGPGADTIDITDGTITAIRGDDG